METMVLRHGNKDTTVAIVRETQKAILVKGNCSEAWLPKKAITEDGWIADWFSPNMDLRHAFLFSAPYTEETLPHR